MQDQEKQGIDDALMMGNQKRGIDYYLEQLKLTIFQVLFVIRNSEDEEGGMFGFYFFNALDYFQMHQFPFYVTIYYLWKQDTFMEFITLVQNLFQISNYIPSLTYESLLMTVYILLFFILLIILDIIYVSYSFSRNRFYWLWPLLLLKKITSFVVTVGFLPITETLTSILQCYVDPDTGKYIIYGYNNIFVECWQDWHTFHAVLDLTFIIFFSIICSIVAYAFFEPAMNTNDRSARQDSNGEVAFITNKITCQLMFSLLRPNYPEQAWIIVITSFILSLWLFKQYNFNDPYYDFQVGLFYCICSTLYLWACFMLLVCKVLESTDFTGGFIAWLIGVPFIISIMLLTKKSKIETLVKSQTKFRSGEQIWSHIRYVLQLIQNQDKDRNSYMLLVGYIEKHKETCNYDDCPLKTKLKQKKKGSQNDINEIIRGLIQELDRMFVQGLKKFPNSTYLRIFYALFLIERRNNKQKALEQFELAQYTKPALYQEFIIYRYKKDIKSKGMNSQQGEDDDIVNAIAFKNYLSLCEEKMKFSANLHKEFWIELKEDQPDLGRLMNIGARISRVTNEARENYENMQKINSNMPYTMQVFGNFMIHVMNDSKGGINLLNKAKQLKEHLRKNQQVHKDIFNFETDQIPFIYVSAKKSDTGNILQMNSLFTAYFGYTKEEIVGKKINILMPQKYAENHDKYMSNFFDNFVLNLRQEVGIESEYLDVDQNRLFKHKNGYLFPLTYQVTLHLDSLVYIATFKSEATLKTQIYFVIDKFSQILEMSSSAITFFELELKNLGDKIKLNDFIPDVLTKNAKDVFSKIPKKDGFYYFNCQVKEIILPFHNPNDSDEEQKKSERTGCYVIRLDKIEKNEANLKYMIKKGGQHTGSISNPDSELILKAPSQSKIQNLANMSQDSQVPLRNQDVDLNLFSYMQELYENPQVDEIRDLFKQCNEETESVPSIDLAGSIITKRYINGQIVSINEEQEQLFLQILEEEEEDNSLFRNQGNNFEDEDDYKLFTYNNSANLIQIALRTHHRHPEITTFKIYSSLWIVFILAMTSLQQYFCSEQFNNYRIDVDVLQLINNQLIEINRLTSRVLDLAVYSANLYTYNTTEIANDISISATSVIDFNSAMNSIDYINFQSKFEDELLFRFYTDNGYYDDSLRLETALVVFCSLALNSSVTNYQSITFNNIYYQGVVHNYFDVLYQQICDISSSTYDNIKDIMDNPQVDLLILLSASIFVSVMAMIKFIFLMFAIKTQRENILFLFLDIPTYHLDVLYKKCDRFLKNYVSIEELQNKQEQQGFESSEDEKELQEEKIEVLKAPDEDESDILLRQTQNRKKIIKKYRQNRIKGNQGIIIQFFVISVFTLVFTVYNILGSQSQQQQINFLLPQYYQSLYTINNYGYYINIQKLMMLDYTIQIKGIPVSEYAINNLTIFTGNAEKMSSFNFDILSELQTFRDKYINIYYGNLCEQIMKTAEMDQCQQIINSNLQLGMYNTESYFLEYFRINIQNFYQNITQNSLLLNATQFFEIDRSLYNYVYDAITNIITYERDLISSGMDNIQNIQLILLIIFIVLLVSIFLFVWIPFLNGLNTQINQTIEMLNMIPLEVVKENKSIRRFVKSLIKSMNK
ncbi:unnamed protein product [Paramecium pentaurelia]|uniref:PAS domain-containing protein n=1 Tax=Paramecium pentaurelia TaxID=43138 RepID=A0A8S1TD82_9CILI|nr:unnamed protein product [Paramecium pentaurelia]